MYLFIVGVGFPPKYSCNGRCNWASVSAESAKEAAGRRSESATAPSDPIATAPDPIAIVGKLNRAALAVAHDQPSMLVDVRIGEYLTAERLACSVIGSAATFTIPSLHPLPASLSAPKPVLNRRQPWPPPFFLGAGGGRHTATVT